MVIIPKYILEHIEKNNRLLVQAEKHSEIVNDWYEKQLKKLEAEESEIDEEEFAEIQNNWNGVGTIDSEAIKYNLELLSDDV